MSQLNGMDMNEFGFWYFLMWKADDEQEIQ